MTDSELAVIEHRNERRLGHVEKHAPGDLSLMAMVCESFDDTNTLLTEVRRLWKLCAELVGPEGMQKDD